MKKAALGVEMKIKNTSMENNDFSIDKKLKIDFLEDYELDMYQIEINKHEPSPIKSTTKKSLYQIVKEEAIIWLITGSTVGAAYLIDKYLDSYQF